MAVACSAYHVAVRPLRRRRPAGPPQVPIQFVLPVPVAPALVRLGPDRSVLDAPWGLHVTSIAHIWHEPRAPGGWMRVVWPVDVVNRRFIAPNDLQIGHVLEMGDADGTRCFGWVADADGRRFVLAPAPNGPDAMTAAGQAVDLWRAAELVRIGNEWQRRLNSVRRASECD